MLQFSFDSLQILRLFFGFFWGGGVAAVLQYTRMGRYVAVHRTWVAVVVGVGVDMIIAYPSDWYTIAGVFVTSSVPVIFRSLWNEHKEEETNYNAHKIKDALEISIKLSTEIIDGVTEILDSWKMQPQAAGKLTKLLLAAVNIKSSLTDARRESAKAPKGGR